MKDKKALIKTKNYQPEKHYNNLQEITELILKDNGLIETKDKFVKVEKGNFYMGSYEEDNEQHAYEKPLHHVTINYNFYISRNLVTIGEYNEYLINIGDMPIELNSPNDNYLPITDISWHDAKDYCKWLSKKEDLKYRLPTEAEWEYVCRAGTDTKYFFGKNIKDLDKYAWYQNNSENKVHKVGLKKPNPWGIYDMYGNVWEWCEDIWEDNYDNALSDGSALNKMQQSNSFLLRGVTLQAIRAVIRGGSFSNIDKNIYSSFRIFEYIDNSEPNIGFRIIRE